jgi:tetratricopeptide (TPR) repeat protein
MLLWKSLRSVLLWADSAPADRKALFPADAGQRRLDEVASVLDESDELRVPLEALAEVLAAPEAAKGPELAGACHQVHCWASGADAPRTALEFLQAASLCHPAHAPYALEVGRMARAMGQNARAEAWFQRAIGMSRRAKDWVPYIQAYLDHGRILVAKGALPAARRSYIKALRRSVRQGLRQWEAHARHDLFVLEDRAGDPGKALGHAASALRAFSSRPEELPGLACDLASFWTKRGRSDLAYPLLRGAAMGVEHDARGAALGLLARASGAVGEADTFDEAVEALDRWWNGPGVAGAWVDVARGALALGRPDQAREAARRAETMARRWGEDPAPFRAEAVLSTAREGEPGRATPLQVDGRTEDELAEALLSRLDGDTGSRRRSRALI